MRTRIPLLQKTIGIQIFHGTGAAFTGSKPSFFTCSTTTFPASVTMPLCQTTTAAHGIGKMSATDFFRQRKSAPAVRQVRLSKKGGAYWWTYGDLQGICRMKKYRNSLKDCGMYRKHILFWYVRHEACPCPW